MTGQLNIAKVWVDDTHVYAETTDGLRASYAFSDFVKLSAGFSYLMGTETMAILQQLEETRRMRWGWLMLSITPKIYTTTWQDKK